MSTLAWVALGLAVWLAAGVIVAVGVGRAIRVSRAAEPAARPDP